MLCYVMIYMLHYVMIYSK